MSSFNQYLDGEYAGSFDEFLDDNSDFDNIDSIYDYEGFDDEYYTDASAFKKAVKAAKDTYSAATKVAREAYHNAVKEAKSAYSKSTESAKQAYQKTTQAAKTACNKAGNMKDRASAEIDKTVKEIKENKELSIKVAAVSAAATAAVLGLAYCIFRKKK